MEGYRDMYRGWVDFKLLFRTVIEWWEWVKGRSKRYAIRYCRVRAARERREFNKLQRQLQGCFRMGNLVGGGDMGGIQGGAGQDEGGVRAESKIIFVCLE